MAIHTEVEKSMHGGFQKGIQASAMQMILDNLQKYQYQYPIKSTVREIISNGIDSITEREVARKILSGTHRLEDFFEARDGEIYEDSKFDPSYYDLKWLSTDTKVHMTYIAGNAIEKDKVEFRDNGVGLGDYRLIKYFSLGYSTKRLSKLPLGKFGIGGKSPLSTGVDFFTMETRYNGKKFRFNIYDHTIDSIIPVLDRYITIDEGTDHPYKVGYESTEELNGVTITLSVKKNHRQQYIDAVKSQLLYFDNIDFNILTDEGSLQRVDYQAEILYEDDLIVLSDNNYYSKPHILLNKVNYGYISFEELELEEKVGNIGIKIAPEEVDVNPSRESVIWSEKTKNMVLRRFEEVVEIATGLLQKELRETDYLKWLRTCYSMANRFFAGDSITSRLAKIVDLTQIKPRFLPNPSLRFSSTTNLGGLYIRTTELSKEIVANRTKTKIVRKELKNIQTVIDKPIILMKKNEKASNRRDKYLLMTNALQTTGYHAPSIFVTIQEPMTVQEMMDAGMTTDFIEYLTAKVNKQVGEETNNRYQTWEALEKSADVRRYEDITVPEDFNGSDEEVLEDEVLSVTLEQKQEAEVVRLSEKERRTAEGKILLYTPRAVDGKMPAVYDPNDPYVMCNWVPNPLYDASKPMSPSNNFSTIYKPESGTILHYKAYEWQKIEISIKEMNDWDTEEIYYSDGQDELMNFAAMLSRDSEPSNTLGYARRRTAIKDGSHSLYSWQDKMWWKLNHLLIASHKVSNHDALKCQHFYDNKEIKLIKTSRPNFKYLKDFRTIDRFFLTITNKTITISNLLIRWNTARLVKGKLENARFLNYFSGFNQKYYEQYQTLRSYVNRNYREVESRLEGKIFGLDKQTYDDMVSHLDKVKEFQEYVLSKPTSEEVRDMAQYMFGNPDLQDGMAVDMEIMKVLRQVNDYANGCGTLLNYIPQLVNGGMVPADLEMEIKHYLEYKGMLNYRTEEEVEEADYKSLAGPEIVEFGDLNGNSSTMVPEDLTPHEKQELQESEFFNEF